MRATTLKLLLIGAAALTGQHSALAQQASSFSNPAQTVTIRPGGAIAELANRSALRAYAVKISEGSITANEMADYLIKGGSYQREKSYDRVHDFFVGSDQGSILRFFIDGPRGVESRLPADRLKSLQLLLDVGADPNLQGPSDSVGGENLLSPTLFAAAGNDLEALKLLIAKGGNLALREEKYAGHYGPALGLATRPDVLDFLLKNGAQPSFTDENGNNFLALAVERNHASHQLEKIGWLLDHGVSPHAANRSKDTAVTRAQAVLDMVAGRLKEAREHLGQRLLEVEAESWPGLQLSAQAVQARRLEAAQAAQAAYDEDSAYLQAIQHNMQAALKLFAVHRRPSIKP